MSEKVMDRIENTSPLAAQASMSHECWDPSSMRSINGRQQIAQVPGDFGQFQLSDNSQSQSSDSARSSHLHTAGITENVQLPTEATSVNSNARQHLRSRVHPGADHQHHPQLNATADKQHHSQLNGTANDNQRSHHDAKSAIHKKQEDFLVGKKDIEATHDSQYNNINAETVYAHFPASTYKTGQSFPLVTIPSVPGHENYYNGLKDAKFMNNALTGTPVHIDKDGNTTNTLDHEISIPLHHSKK
ncbi:MAG: hypothetical protein JST89_17765 [Cyanobacteria bacterium SZAS-4]|nr:hypothetical protein [Cyanobacteria bacterium SZAS-4]